MQPLSLNCGLMICCILSWATVAHDVYQSEDYARFRQISHQVKTSAMHPEGSLSALFVA